MRRWIEEIVIAVAVVWYLFVTPLTVHAAPLTFVHSLPASQSVAASYQLSSITSTSTPTRMRLLQQDVNGWDSYVVQGSFATTSVGSFCDSFKTALPVQNASSTIYCIEYRTVTAGGMNQPASLGLVIGTGTAYTRIMGLHAQTVGALGGIGVEGVGTGVPGVGDTSYSPPSPSPGASYLHRTHVYDPGAEVTWTEPGGDAEQNRSVYSEATGRVKIDRDGASSTISTKIDWRLRSGGSTYGHYSTVTSGVVLPSVVRFVHQDGSYMLLGHYDGEKVSYGYSAVATDCNVSVIGMVQAGYSTDASTVAAVWGLNIDDAALAAMDPDNVTYTPGSAWDLGLSLGPAYEWATGLGSSIASSFATAISPVTAGLLWPVDRLQTVVDEGGGI